MADFCVNQSVVERALPCSFCVPAAVRTRRGRRVHSKAGAARTRMRLAGTASPLLAAAGPRFPVPGWGQDQSIVIPNFFSILQSVAEFTHQHAERGGAQPSRLRQGYAWQARQAASHGRLMANNRRSRSRGVAAASAPQFECGALGDRALPLKRARGAHPNAARLEIAPHLCGGLSSERALNAEPFPCSCQRT